MNEIEIQRNANIQYDGWQKFKENNPETPISAELDAAIESNMWAANGIEILTEPTESEKVQIQAEMVAELLSHDPKYIESCAKIMAQENPINNSKYIDKFRVFAARSLVVGGLSLGILGTLAIVKTPMGGVIKDFVTSPIKKMIELDNQKLEDEYKSMSSEVEELTGMTPEEIMEKGRNIH